MCPAGFTHRELDDLVKHDIRRDVEVKDEILWRGEKTLGGGLFIMSSTSQANLQILQPQFSVKPLEPSGECMQHEKELKIGFRRNSRRPELSVVIRYR